MKLKETIVSTFENIYNYIKTLFSIPVFLKCLIEKIKILKYVRYSFILLYVLC